MMRIAMAQMSMCANIEKNLDKTIIPESIRTCALNKADLIIIPTANHRKEPMELFEWEIRVQAFQNLLFIAMCNRVGAEDEIDFCGQSLVASPDGSLLAKADEKEGLILTDIQIEETTQARQKRNWLQFAKEEHK